MLAFFAIIAFILAILLFVPFFVHVELENSAFSAKVSFLGFWFVTDGRKGRRGFLWKEFPPEKAKSITSEEKSEDKHDKKTVSKKDKSAKPKKEAPLSFWLKRKGLFVRIVSAVLRFVADVAMSFRVVSHHLFLKIGNGEPEITGALYGWMFAIKAGLPKLNLDFGYDFRPSAKWDFYGHVDLRNSLFRLLLWPLIKLIWRLPKLNMISAYREHKRITKAE